MVDECWFSGMILFLWYNIMFPFFTCQCPPMHHNAVNDLRLMADTACKFPCRRWSAVTARNGMLRIRFLSIKHSFPYFCLVFLFAVREEQRCRSRRAAWLFAKSSAAVRERQITLLCRRCRCALPFSKFQGAIFTYVGSRLQMALAAGGGYVKLYLVSADSWLIIWVLSVLGWHWQVETEEYIYIISYIITLIIDVFQRSTFLVPRYRYSPAVKSSTRFHTIKHEIIRFAHVAIRQASTCVASANLWNSCNLWLDICLVFRV